MPQFIFSCEFDMHNDTKYGDLRKRLKIKWPKQKLPMLMLWCFTHAWCALQNYTDEAIQDEEAPADEAPEKGEDKDDDKDKDEDEE